MCKFDNIDLSPMSILDIHWQEATVNSQVYISKKIWQYYFI